MDRVPPTRRQGPAPCRRSLRQADERRYACVGIRRWLRSPLLTPRGSVGVRTCAPQPTLCHIFNQRVYLLCVGVWRSSVVKTVSDSLETDFPMKAVLSIVKSGGRGTWPHRSRAASVTLYYSNRVEYTYSHVGVWRSSVARTVRDGEVVRSNRITPTIKYRNQSRFFFIPCCTLNAYA